MKQKIILIGAGLIILIILTATLAYAIPRINIPKTVTQSIKTEPGFYKVTYVSDGDTFTVNMDGREEKVRLIGVDTPETVKPNSPTECYGKVASDFAKSTLANQTVRLEADPINQNRDRYGRLLRYAYLNDGRLFNAELIRLGYGFAYLSFPFSKAEEFQKLQTEARKNEKGVWNGECTITEPDGVRPKSNQL